MFSPELMEDAHFEEDATNAVVWNDLDCCNCQMCNEETKPTTTRSASPPDLTCAAHNDGRVCRYKENGEFPLGQNGKPVSPYVCWNNGKITKETSYSVSLSEWPYQHNVDQCVGICQQLSNCQASAWNRDTNRCEFISTSLAEAGYKGVEGSNVFWSDNVCWDCSNFCTDTSSEQSTSGTWTGIDPMTTQPPTTMLTSTRRSDDGEESVSTSTDDSREQSTSEAPTTTTKAPQAEPTDCAVPVASLSDDVTCGLPGAGGNQVQTYRLQNYVIKPVGSLAKCASICLQREDCQGFDYQKGSTVCYPYGIGPAGLGITYNPQSTDRFYDRGCFKCASFQIDLSIFVPSTPADGVYRETSAPSLVALGWAMPRKTSAKVFEENSWHVSTVSKDRALKRGNGSLDPALMAGPSVAMSRSRCPRGNIIVRQTEPQD
ncbi:hypothetical protein NM208_g17149 [Fusarium decemcellulare]|uniref:Uncharacterized protein n=1 Tax=Fusarium decemcellulare TaxID=57161 RepID=A0ACC1R867_9HYPO|nr:hypothetical protein NM208_g17149 [Fusarium decemcellulare]